MVDEKAREAETKRLFLEERAWVTRKDGAQVRELGDGTIFEIFKERDGFSWHVTYADTTPADHGPKEKESKDAKLKAFAAFRDHVMLELLTRKGHDPARHEMT